ncbi:MAG: ribosome small subunit-dependent GTPase A [Flavobacteriales bacterium]
MEMGSVGDERVGLVLQSTGSWYEVLTSTGDRISCRARGRLRLKGDRSTNPIAVGDRVRWELSDVDRNEGLVTGILERRNAIIRRSVNLSRESHVVAANLDRAFLVVTLAEPATSTGFVDRFLVTAEAYGVPVTLVFNKVDATDAGALKDWDEVYQSAGYDTLRTSAKTGEGLPLLQRALAASGVNLLSGHSGVGKSSLINALIPGLVLKTDEVSDVHGKGKHTTTFATMHPLPEGGFVVDTPGIKGFGLVHLERDSLHHYFPEFFARLPECKFHNCLHRTEPGCAVHAALQRGEVAASRLENYLEMYETFDESSGYR